MKKYFQSVDAGHGRIETRTAVISHHIGWLQERHAWPGLGAIGKATATRGTGGKQTSQSRYFLRRIALNFTRTEPAKGSMRGHIEKPGCSDNFTLDLIRAAMQV